MEHRLQKGILALAVVFAVLFLLPYALGDSYSAETIRLLRYDGNVEILDASGSPRFVMENVRFANGETMRTGAESTASVSLDSTKILSIDQNSTVKFEKNDNHMVLTLNEGTLFLDVREKLDENESLDITTSTMTVGIRGTITVVSVLPAAQAAKTYGLTPRQTPTNASEKVTVFGVLEGSAAVTQKNGQKFAVHAGQIAVVGQDTVIAGINKRNLTPFLQDQFEDNNTATRVMTACPKLFEDYDFPADGDWEFTGKVMIIAQSASKLYDGTPLTRPGDILVYNLPEMFDINASAVGSVTNAGTVENPIGSYAIYNKNGENVTSHFNIIETVPGKLVVDPAPMTVWTGSATKRYDGKPLTCNEAGFNVISGKTEQEPWRNTSMVLSEREGETLYGLSGELIVHGTNPLTGKTSQIVLAAGEKLTVLLSDENDADSITFSVDKISEDEIPKQILRLYADNPELLDQACADTGWDKAKVLERISQLPSKDEETTVKDGLTVSIKYAGGLMRELTNAHINIDSDITDYNGRALSAQEAKFKEVRIDDSVKVTATGSRTAQGESKNTYTIDWGNENQKNFIITEDLGTLKVLPALTDVTVTARSATKVYDGKPLNAKGVTVTGLAKGYTLTAKVAGKATDAGTVSSRVTGYQVFDENGEDVTEYYPDLKLVAGTLKINPATLKVTTGSASRVYNGKNLSNSKATITGFVDGEKADVSSTGRIKNAGKTSNGYSVKWTNAKESNYKISADLGSLKVEPLKVRIDVPDDITLVYSGTAAAPTPTLTFLNGEHSGSKVKGKRVDTKGAVFEFELFTGDTVRVTMKGAGTNVGNYNLKGAVSVSGSSSNFEFSGSALKTFPVYVEPAPITIKTGSASRNYDGTELKSNKASVSGLKGNDKITVKPDGSIINVGSTENTYDISWGKTNPENYYISSETLGKLIVKPAQLTIVTDSASKVYDGTDLTAGIKSVTGLSAEDQMRVSVTATGKRKNAGKSQNTYTIEWDDASEENYTITEKLGTLEVTPLQLKFTIGDNAYMTYSGSVPPSIFTIWPEPTLVVAGETISYRSRQFNGTSENVNSALYVYNSPVEGEGFGLSISGYNAQAGTHTLTGYLSEVDIFSDTLSSNYSASITNGSFKVDPRPLTITTGSGSKVYDGTPLTNSSVTFGGLGLAATDTDKVTVTATGTITNPGSTANTYSINWGGVSSGNYTVTPSLGTLEVTPDYSAPITVTAKSASKVYDGTALTENGYTVSGAPSWFTYSIAVTGSQTNAGSSDNVVSECKFFYGSEDVTSKLTNLTKNKGTLTVEPLRITVSAQSRTIEYMGSGVWASSTVAYANGPSSGATLSLTDAGADGNYHLYYYKLNTGDTLTVRGPMCGPGVGEHTYNPTCSVSGTTGNYDITVSGCTVTISKAQLTVKTGSASKMYDGTALTKTDGAELTGLKGYDTATVTAKGTITNVGSTSNTYTINWGSTNSANYTVNEQLGTLTVSKNTTQVTITLGSQSKDYDGTPIVGDEEDYTYSGLPSDDFFVTIGGVTGSQTNAGTSASHISQYTIWDAEENNVTSYFTNVKTVDGSLTVEKLRIKVALSGYEVSWSEGETFFPDVKVSYLGGDEHYFGRQINPIDEGQVSGGVWTLRYRLFTGDVITVKVNGTGSEPGTYTIPAPERSVTSGSSGNYDLSAASGCTMVVKLSTSDTGSP
ncbi:MAG: FecR domain-containing protein [Clostridiales bacterium]|nr:FecR domain-containing protein [Clostridiales bacterium]